jgi:predicted nicotinamide N-methyase
MGSTFALFSAKKTHIALSFFAGLQIPAMGEKEEANVRRSQAWVFDRPDDDDSIHT